MLRKPGSLLNKVRRNSACKTARTVQLQARRVQLVSKNFITVSKSSSVRRALIGDTKLPSAKKLQDMKFICMYVYLHV